MGLVDPNVSIFTMDVTGSLRGLLALSQGYLLTSICLTSMLIWVIDREFLRAAAWALVAAVLSAFGLMHAGSVFLPWQGPAEPPAPFDKEQWNLTWQFVGAYLLTMVCFLLCA